MSFPPHNSLLLTLNFPWLKQSVYFYNFSFNAHIFKLHNLSFDADSKKSWGDFGPNMIYLLITRRQDSGAAIHQESCSQDKSNPSIMKIISMSLLDIMHAVLLDIFLGDDMKLFDKVY